MSEESNGMKNLFDQGYFSTQDLREMGFKEVGDDVYIAKNSTVIGLENISFGNRVRIDAYTNIICEIGEIEFGSNIHIGAGSYIGGIGGVTLCDFSGTSQGVKIYSGSDDFSGNSLTNSTIPIAFREIHEGKVVLEKHVIIGSSSVILPGCTIGEGVAVGALSLVNKSLEPWNVYGGVPAKKIRVRSKALLEVEQRYINLGQD